ncbi:MAG TPA: glycosyl hydrolase 115 family protein [Woeseiaceae bacterium]|nr:glycosyl hydrolase 115 family protein [Woeseiaceae bacterium]
MIRRRAAAKFLCTTSPPKRASLVAFALMLFASDAFSGLGEPGYISFVPDATALGLVQDGAAIPLWLDAGDQAGVLRAARDLQSDIERVTGVQPDLLTSPVAKAGAAIIAGTLGHSSLIDDLVARGKLDVRAIEGRWESFVREVVDAPMPGVDRALVIAGSDRRGTIYGLYDVSEHIGVSPWYWWADVPVVQRDALFAKPVRHVAGEPAVKYRGIFLNDEAPALSGWATEKFGGFNHRFYAHVFELILRLRGNFLWPAMWGSAFVDDDPQNAPLAHEYGIVMGTSHHEPLTRAHDEWRRYGEGPWDYAKNESRLREFWRSGVERVQNYETLFTVGMRGDGDEAMSEETNVALLEKIVADQRDILAAVTGRPPADVPQVWALYKEVQEYYERGMRVPDDVTLLWSDDNWGNLRRLPTAAERERRGGAGVYYHFDYVGGPRNYKWLNTVPISKVQEQMNLAWRHGADRIWIVNVGDLKPMEFPTEFFLRMAWDPERWTYDRVDDYSHAWAAREFGDQHAREIAALIKGYTKLNGRRKPEMLTPGTYSLVNYREAERVLGEWQDLVRRAERLEARLPEEYRDAFFQLVLYPVKASAVVHELYISVGRNRLHALQGSVVANKDAARARELFELDGVLADQYHTRVGGKWNHMMSQINLGYTYWQQPEIETMPAVSEVRPRAGASMAVAIEGSETAWPSYGAPEAVLPPLHVAAKGTRWVEVFNRGRDAFTYQVRTDHPWLQVTPEKGMVQDVVRLEVGVDWRAVPAGATEAYIGVEGSTGERIDIKLPINNPPAPGRSFERFFETDGHVVIEAPEASRSVSGSGVSWQILPDFGRTNGAVTPMPVTAPVFDPAANAPRLEYDVYLYSSGEITVELHCAPSLDFQPGEPLRVAVSFDDMPPQTIELATAATQESWKTAVADGVRRITSRHRVTETGYHVLKLRMVTPGVVVQRIIIDTGGVRPSYLGPPPSGKRSGRPPAAVDPGLGVSGLSGGAP